ncbi:hypothetical protein [Agromyces albus]|uniref:hypothetical protein n=1 Tax=Agromyces albus TaxID=205332 RepID=UPI0027873C0E|nr:hypothetical protein [Agromyces albus]MDQ0576482.1 hypothetical protein [Agromyces albus]
MAPSVGFRRAGFAAVALASVFLLAACAASGSPAEHYAGLPVSEHQEEGGHEEPENEEGEPVAAWVGQGAQLAVTIWGSSSCPQVGRNITVVEPAGEGNTVAIDLVERPEDEVCTMDLAPYTTVFWTPVDVTTTEPLRVEVGDSAVTVPVK